MPDYYKYFCLFSFNNTHLTVLMLLNLIVIEQTSFKAEYSISFISNAFVYEGLIKQCNSTSFFSLSVHNIVEGSINIMDLEAVMLFKKVPPMTRTASLMTNGRPFGKA